MTSGTMDDEKSGMASRGKEEEKKKKKEEEQPHPNPPHGGEGSRMTSGIIDEIEKEEDE